MIDGSLEYYIGSWRRSPFDVNQMPQSLNVDEKSGSLRLANFDSNWNNLWRFIIHPSRTTFSLELVNPSPTLAERYNGARLYVSNGLALSPEAPAALELSMESHEPFRKGPMDVAMRMFSSDGSSLVSIEKTGRVMLVDPREAEQRLDKNGDFLINIAWEATPDIDEAIQGGLDGVPDWIHETLMA